MKLPAALSSLLLLSGVSVAQEVQSKPFNLVIQSRDRSLNGQKFTACHTGAAIESLCLLVNSSGTRFYLNTTEGSQSPLGGYEPSGILVYNLPIDPIPYSESMTFSIDPSTNVALPLFEPGPPSQYVTFDKNGQLAIFSYLDDTHEQPNGSQVRALKNWYLCQTYYTGYQYRTLSWVLGSGNVKPQNPSCVKIEVQRKFV